MTDAKKNAEQEAKLEKQSLELTDIPQELTETDLKDVQGGARRQAPPRPTKSTPPPISPNWSRP